MCEAFGISPGTPEVTFLKCKFVMGILFVF